MARWKRPRRPFPVDAQTNFFSFHGEGLDLRDVVADVVEKPHPEFPRPHPQRLFESLPCPVHEHLPVRPGIVRRAGHRSEVVPAPVRVQPGAGKLAVGQVDPDLPHMFDHPRQVIVANLVAETPGAAVNQHADLSRLKAESRGGGFVEDLLHDLDLEEMVPRPECPELVLPPQERPVAHLLRIGARHYPAVLGRLQVCRRTVAVADGPGRAFDQDLPFLLLGEFQGPPGTNAGGDVLKECRDQRRDALPDVGETKTRGHEAAAAVDVVPDAAGGDDPLVEVKGRDPADGKTVAPMHVRHSERVLHDPRQVGDVGHLPRPLVGPHPLQELLAGVEESRNAHPSRRRDLPPPFVDSAETGVRHHPVILQERVEPGTASLKNFRGKAHAWFDKLRHDKAHRDRKQACPELVEGRDEAQRSRSLPLRKQGDFLRCRQTSNTTLPIHPAAVRRIEAW